MELFLDASTWPRAAAVPTTAARHAALAAVTRRRPHGRGAHPGRRRSGPALTPAGGHRPRRVRGPALGRLRERHRLRAPRRARPAAGRLPRAGRHLPARRAVPPPPGGRAAAPARAPALGHPRPPRAPQPGRRERLPHRRVRRGAVVPGRRRAAHPHRAATRSSSRSWWPAPATCTAARPRRRPLPWTVAELVRAAARRPRPRRARHGHEPRPCSAAGSFDLLAAVTGASEAELIDLPARRGGPRAAGRDRAPTCSASTTSSPERRSRARLLGRERRRLHEAALDALRAAGSRDHVALAHHAQGAGRYDDMVAEARLGRPRVAARSARPTRRCQLAEIGPRPRPRTTSSCWRWPPGRAGSAACSTTPLAHGDRWLRLARQARRRRCRGRGARHAHPRGLRGGAIADMVARSPTR